jgi:hypothetical protein
LGQLFQPTPELAKSIATGVLYTAAIVNIILASIPQIPTPLNGDIAQYSLEGVTLVHAITRLFGISITNDPTQN